MPKRKLRAEDTPQEQDEALQSIQSLQASQRRAVVHLLNPDGRGRRTTQSQPQQHKCTYDLLQELPVETEEKRSIRYDAHAVVAGFASGESECMSIVQDANARNLAKVRQ